MRGEEFGFMILECGAVGNLRTQHRCGKPEIHNRSDLALVGRKKAQNARNGIQHRVLDPAFLRFLRLFAAIKT
jgi:hypothetical protein